MSGFSQKSFFEEKGSYGGLKRDRFDLKLQKKSDAARKMNWRIGFKDVKDKNKIDRYLVLLQNRIFHIVTIFKHVEKKNTFLKRL